MRRIHRKSCALTLVLMPCLLSGFVAYSARADDSESSSHHFQAEGNGATVTIVATEAAKTINDQALGADLSSSDDVVRLTNFFCCGAGGAVGAVLCFLDR